jgi:hypothetical protein
VRNGNVRGGRRKETMDGDVWDKYQSDGSPANNMAPTNSDEVSGVFAGLGSYGATDGGQGQIARN